MHTRDKEIKMGVCNQTSSTLCKWRIWIFFSKGVFTILPWQSVKSIRYAMKLNVSQHHKLFSHSNLAPRQTSKPSLNILLPCLESIFMGRRVWEQNFHSYYTYNLFLLLVWLGWLYIPSCTRWPQFITICKLLIINNIPFYDKKHLSLDNTFMTT